MFTFCFCQKASVAWTPGHFEKLRTTTALLFHVESGPQKTVITLVFQIPAEKVFWVGFQGPNTSSQGVWKPRVSQITPLIGVK